MDPAFRALLDATDCEICGRRPVFYLDRRHDGERALCSTCYSNLDKRQPPMARRRAALPAPTAPLTVDPAAIAGAAAVFAAQAKPLADYYCSCSIQTAEQAEWAAQQIHAVAGVIKAIEAEREKVDEPIRAMQDYSRERFGQPIAELQRAIDHLKAQTVALRQATIAAQQAALAAATSRAEVDSAVAVLVPVPEGMHERELWSAEIVDVNQIPREFWVVDVAKLNALAREQKAAFNVPGCRPHREIILARNASR